MPYARIHRLSAAAPNDTAPLAECIAAGTIDPAAIVAVIGKTEGNGCVNDFTRGYAVQSLQILFARHLPQEAVERISMVMSGGTEGGMAPHWIVVEVLAGDHAHPGPSLAVGRHITPDIDPAVLGRVGQVALVADGVRAAMAEAGIADPAHVHFVQIKCPLLTADRVAAARRAGRDPATSDTLKSMGLSRAASALGVAVALGEIEPAAISDGAIGTDRKLYSGRASASAGIELMGHEIVVFGMAAGWSGPLAIDHAVMADGIDTEPVRAMLGRLGLSAQGQLQPPQRDRLVAMLAKAEASSTGRLRGYRHTMLDDSDISSTRHARGFVVGALAGLVGHAEIYVSGGAEHQGPDGGGPVAAIVDRAARTTSDQSTSRLS